MKIPVGNGEAIYLQDGSSSGRDCEVHTWPVDGLAERLVAAMRETHGKGGINVCVDCIDRAREDARRRAAP
jgi:hypothetical protein